MNLFKRRYSIENKDNVRKDILTLFTVNQSDTIETIDNTQREIELLIRALEGLSIKTVTMRANKIFEENYKK